MITKFIKKTLILSVSGLAAFGWSTSYARENVTVDGQRKSIQGQRKTTAAACRAAQATIDLDINNVRARLMTGGDMWWNQGINQASYEVPAGSGKHSLFAGSLWVGGYDPQGSLKVAAQTYRQNGNDYWPGPLTGPASEITTQECAQWDRFWKVSAADILAFREAIASGDVSAMQNPDYADIVQWPATGSVFATDANGATLSMLATTTRSYAPFEDVNDNGVYEPDLGEYPKIKGDQYIWWVFNDKGNVKAETESASIGLEVQASAFAFSRRDALNNATFYRYTLINRGTQVLDSAYVATWSDADLGYAFDDYIGCDTTRGLGILYNGTSTDGSGQPNSYGTEVPMVAVDFFEGPKRYYTDTNGVDTFEKLKMSGFYYYNNDFTDIGNPSNLNHYYGYMTGTIRGGQRFTSGNCNAYGAGAITNYVFYGDPAVSTEWSECSCGNKPDDRRFVHSAGPFRLDAGASNDITIGAVWVPDAGGCPSTSFAKITAADDLAQDLFDSDFIPAKGPDAPRLVISELDRKFAFSILNDPSSNNFQEKFGYDDSLKYHTTTFKTRRFADSLYKFEGYRVFQLKNDQTAISDIYNEDGSINTDVAREVLQMDKVNGVKTIYNWVKKDLGNGNDTNWVAQLQVEGKDEGIKHSFVLETDAFSTGTDTRFVNYKTYYFTIVAYAYNDFGATVSATGAVIPSFTGVHAQAIDQQDVPYLESTSGTVYTVMPNPAAANMGTYLRADYGDGIMVKRLEGTGNGGNNISMTQESEDSAIYSPDFYVKHPIYQLSHGPVTVKVIDPVKLVPGDWELYLKGNVSALAPGKGIDAATGSWELVRNYNGATETIYSERNSLVELNEQIIDKYGISVSVQQVVRPGDDQTASTQNGYLGSSISYADTRISWLAGVNDEEGVSTSNWIRAGRYKYEEPENSPPNSLATCAFGDPVPNQDSNQYFESMFNDNELLRGSWAPYTLGYDQTLRAACNFGVAYNGTVNFLTSMQSLQSVDIVLTSDKSKWTRVTVLEMQDVTALAEGAVSKFKPRAHASWNGELDASGSPIYATDPSDTGKSWFPGYAINQETGMRLNIVFSEDSWLKSDYGNDMLWNPTSRKIDELGNVINGGKHYIYVLNTKYDSCKAFHVAINGTINQFRTELTRQMMWVGLPLLNSGFRYSSWRDGFIPTETRLKLRVNRPYAPYVPGGDSASLKNGGLPVYSFKTDDIAPIAVNGDGNPYTSDSLLSRIHAVPNPYYGRAADAGYEAGRLETTIKIINLPQKAVVTIYGLDGTMIRKITKDDDTPEVKWDLKNIKNLPIASGMYLIHVNAEGIGETVIKWFGSVRPIDITNY